MGGTILLADDSITIQKVVELTFGETEHRVVALSSGRELLRRLPDVRPDVILCDVVMPDLNGYEVCQTLKADPATLHIPLVLLTGTFEPFDRDRALAAGCDAIVTKPFEGRELVNVVEDLMRRSRAPHVAEPEPSFFPGMGAPEEIPGIEFTTTGFDQMVAPPPAEPQVPDHGIEMTGVSAPTSETAPAGETGFEFGSAAAAPPTQAAPQPERTDDSWIKRIDTEAPEVGSMQGEFFEESPAAEPTPVAAEAPPILEPWEESAVLQARAAEPVFEAPDAEPAVAAPGADGFAPEEPAFPAPKGGPAFAGFVAPPGWEEPEAREEPAVGTWPAAPAAPEPAAVLQPLNPARESIAAAWDVADEPLDGAESAEGRSVSEESGLPHPEPGFPFGAPEATAGASDAPPEEEPAPLPMETVAEHAAPVTEAVTEAAPEVVAEPEVPAAWATPGEAFAPEPTPAPTEAAPVEAVVPVPEVTPVAELVEAAPPEGEPPSESQVVVDAEPLVAEELAAPPVAEAVPTAAPAPAALALSDELIELVADRVLARIPTPAIDLSEDQIAAVAERAVLLIPPPPPPELPPLSYELEESDIQRVAQRIMDILPPPAPTPLAEEEVELVAQRAVQLVPTPQPQPLELPDSEIDRITGHVMLALPEPAPPVLPESEIARVLERVQAMLPEPQAGAAVPGELSEAAVEQIAQRVLQLATPIVERIAWEVLPDMAEMLVRRRIEELEKDAEQ